MRLLSASASRDAGATQGVPAAPPLKKQRSHRLLAAPPLDYLAPPSEESLTPVISAKSAQASLQQAKHKAVVKYGYPHTQKLVILRVEQSLGPVYLYSGLFDQ